MIFNVAPILMENVSEISLIPHSQAQRPSVAEGFRSLFYALSPAESSFKDVSQVPKYMDTVSKIFGNVISVHILCFPNLKSISFVVLLKPGRLQYHVFLCLPTFQ